MKTIITLRIVLSDIEDDTPEDVGLNLRDYVQDHLEDIESPYKVEDITYTIDKEN